MVCLISLLMFLVKNLKVWLCFKVDKEFVINVLVSSKIMSIEL